MTRKLEVTGPHNQRIAALNQRISGKELFQLYTGKGEDPLKQLIDKYRRQARNRQQYSEEILQQKIQPIDKLLEYNSRLAPVLTSLEKQNNTLRGEISILSHELRKSLDACESLIQQNKQQKTIILNKNEDIKKIIETIAVNETQMRGELEHKNYLLQQENSILIKHLEQIKIEKGTWNTQISELEEEMNRTTHKLLTVQNHLEEALGREKEVSKRLFVTQQALNDNLNEISQLKRELEDQKLQNNRLKNELELMRVEDRTSLKDKFEAEIASIIQEYEILKEERQGIVKAGQKYRIQNQHLHSKVNNLQRQLEKAISNLQLTNSLLNEQKSKNANLNSNSSKLQVRINELKSNNETMRYELQRAQNISLQKQRMYQKEIDSLRAQIEDRNREVERKLKEIKQSSENEMARKQREIQQLRRNNQQLREMNRTR